MLHVPVLRRDDDTDTDSTDEDSSFGSDYSKYSHDSTSLSHQHWVQQAVSAGAFSVHDTESAEAHHKYCMQLASLRVDICTTRKLKNPCCNGYVGIYCLMNYKVNL